MQSFCSSQKTHDEAESRKRERNSRVSPHTKFWADCQTDTVKEQLYCAFFEPRSQIIADVVVGDFTRHDSFKLHAAAVHVHVSF